MARPVRRRGTAAAIAVMLLVAACGGDVGSVGTVPPAPGSQPPDPSGLTDTASPGPPIGSETTAPSGATPSPGRTPRPSATSRQTPAPTVAGGGTPAPTPAPPTDTPTPTLTPTIQPTTPGATPQPTPATITVTLYFLLDTGDGPTLVPVPRTMPLTPTVGAATLDELLLGPDQQQLDDGLTTAIPQGAIGLGLHIYQGVATVDITSEFVAGGSERDFEARVAQLTYTISQFSTVRRVRLEVDHQPASVLTGDGTPVDRPVTRDDYLSFLPHIFVESPRWGDEGGHPIVLEGRTDVFEATFVVELRRPDGSVLTSHQIQASCGSGCWGDFRQRLHYGSGVVGRGSIAVFSRSAADGSVQDLRIYPVELVPGP